MHNTESAESTENKAETTDSGQTTTNQDHNSAGETANTTSNPDTNEAKVAELNDKYLRLYSEFENYKRRTSRERIEFSQTAAREFFQAMLPVIDDFERAIKSIDSASDIQALREGVDLIYQKFTKTLFSKGLEIMESHGNDFDPDIHEAITNIPAPSEDLKGKVVDELEKGYLLNGKVIRFAKVVVGN